MVGDAEGPVLQPGSVFAGRYQIIRLLGEGERKQTYLAKDTLLPRQVALALIRPEAARLDPEGTQREADALARAGTHDNVVTFHDWGIVEGTEYLVFDYLQGGTLREYLANAPSGGGLCQLRRSCNSGGNFPAPWPMFTSSVSSTVM